MKKLNTTMLCIITFLFFSRFSVTAENMASIEVMLSDTGGVSFLIKLDPTLETIYTDLYVFKQGDVITKNEKDLPDPIYWHHVWDGAFVSYLGTPGKYYAVLLEAKEQITRNIRKYGNADPRVDADRTAGNEYDCSYFFAYSESNGGGDDGSSYC